MSIPPPLRAALVWGPYRVEQINLDGRATLRVTKQGPRGRYLLGYYRTSAEALAVLERHGVPLDQLVRERERPPAEPPYETDDPECE